jgi:hypothetical protein
VSKLLDDQQRFFEMLCRWGIAAYARGYKCTFGDAYRDPRVNFPYSFPGSFHGKRLAADVNLFKDGKWLTTFDEWEEMGRLWITLGGTWGGEFPKVDPNHLSLGEGRDEA